MNRKRGVRYFFEGGFMRIDRMLSIVVILLNRRRITAKELADRFEVSLRTVYRDIEAINLAGIPVISNQGADGGYAIPDNFKLNKQYLSISDMRSILSALKGINAALDDKDLALIFEKVQSLLPDQAGSAPGGTGEEYIVFDPVGWDQSGRLSQKIQMLYDAAKNLKLIQIDYVDGSGKRTSRRIEPMTVIQKGYSWYLFGHCLERDDIRLFKLSRIKDILVLDQSFRRRAGDYRQIDSRWHPPEDMIQIVLRFSIQLKHVVEDFFDDARVIDETGDFITLTTTFPQGEWLIGMILSYGDGVELLSPSSLRQTIQDRVRKISKIYQ